MSFFKFIYPTTLTFQRQDHIVKDVHSFTFTPDSPTTWHAGQHGMFEVKLASGKTSRRMFSLSSAPSEGVITITTHWPGEALASDFKKALWSLKPGSKVKLRGPVGPMYIRSPSQQNIFIAGGMGITPFRSMLIQSAEKQLLNGTLLYVNHDENPIFKAELLKLSKRLPNFKVKFITTPNQITHETITQASNKPKEAMYYIAGTPKMITKYKKILKELGVSSSHIKKDSFYGYK